MKKNMQINRQKRKLKTKARWEIRTLGKKVSSGLEQREMEMEMFWERLFDGQVSDRKFFKEKVCLSHEIARVM